MAVWMGEQSHQSTFCLVVIHKAVEVHIKNRVRIKEQEVLRQLILQLIQCSSITKRCFFHEILNVNAKRFSCNRGYSDATEDIRVPFPPAIITTFIINPLQIFLLATYALGS